MIKFRHIPPSLSLRNRRIFHWRSQCFCHFPWRGFLASNKVLTDVKIHFTRLMDCSIAGEIVGCSSKVSYEKYPSRNIIFQRKQITDKQSMLQMSASGVLK